MKEDSQITCTWCRGEGKVAEENRGNPFTELFFSLDTIFTLLPLVGIFLIAVAAYMLGILSFGPAVSVWPFIVFFGIVCGIVVLCIRNVLKKLLPGKVECPRCKGSGRVT